MRCFICLAVLAMIATPIMAQDREGQDHPLAQRFPSAFITEYRQPSLDEILVPTGKVVDEDSAANLEPMEGRVTHIDYRVKPAVSALEIERHYSRTFADTGFETVFSCAGKAACGGDMASMILNSGKVAPQGFADGVFTDRLRVLVVRKDDSYVVLHMVEGPDRSQIYQAVIEGATPTA